MPWVRGWVSVWYNAAMSNRPKATCEQCRYYEQQTAARTGMQLPHGNCYGLPPEFTEDRQVADLRPACSLFEMRAEDDCPTEAPTVGSDDAMRRLVGRQVSEDSP